MVTASFREIKEDIGMKVLYVASEAVPFVKTGGLADVAGSLPAALVKPHLRITAVEPDDDRRAIAEHCAARPANLQYVSET